MILILSISIFKKGGELGFYEFGKVASSFMFFCGNMTEVYGIEHAELD